MNTYPVPPGFGCFVWLGIRVAVVFVLVGFVTGEPRWVLLAPLVGGIFPLRAWLHIVLYPRVSVSVHAVLVQCGGVARRAVVLWIVVLIASKLVMGFVPSWGQSVTGVLLVLGGMLPFARDDDDRNSGLPVAPPPRLQRAPRPLRAARMRIVILPHTRVCGSNNKERI